MKQIFVFFLSLFIFSGCQNVKNENHQKAETITVKEPVQADSIYQIKIIPNDTVTWILANVNDSLNFSASNQKITAYKDKSGLLFFNQTKQYQILIDIDASIFYAFDINKKDDLVGWLEDDDYEQSELAKPSIIMGQPSSLKAQKIWEKEKTFLMKAVLKKLKTNPKQQGQKSLVFLFANYLYI